MRPYEALMRGVLTRVDAERAHAAAAAGLRVASAAARVRAPGGTRPVLRAVGQPGPRLAVSALGHTLAGPLGVAAGFDKNAEMIDGLGLLGFSAVEIGTVTATGQPGNARPRMARLPDDDAVVNRMGFNNDGSAAVAQRLRERAARGHAGHGPVVGVNIGKTRTVAASDAASDYAESARRLAPYADYLVVNVSSPNTPGLRDLQAVESLRPLLETVRVAARGQGTEQGPPLLVKIAPDLADADVDAVAELALDTGLDGVVATNTTTSRDGLRSSPEAIAAAGAGGLSGGPLAARATAVLQRLRARTEGRVTLVSAGGVGGADDVWDRLAAGASFVQAYTGLVYGGPRWVARVHRDLERRLDRVGVASLAEVVGAGTEGTR